MNQVNLLGRLTANPDMRYLPSGKAMVMFNLAVQRSYKNQQGEYDADFIRCKAFGKTAETIANFLIKGNRVAVSGEIQTGSYEKDGQRIFTTDVLVNQFTFIDSKTTNSGGNDSGYSQSNGGYNQRNGNQTSQSNPNVGGTNHGGYRSEQDPFERTSDPIDISDSDLPF